MKRAIERVTMFGLLAAACASAHADPVGLGKVEFLVDTNVKLFSFKGEAKELHSKLERDGAKLKRLEIRIPVESLRTGMDLRDKHMLKRVFEKADGSKPDLVFASRKAVCKAGSGQDQVCDLDGELSIRGESRPQKVTAILHGKEVRGSTAVELAKFGIEQPSHAGVKVKDPVQVNFEVKLQ